eukprot:gnl/TRDRNA2_/TRDRNA2_154698_c0_seq1.p1 gnl/TRDRNA2_/TRDRNA2_154698_c0~~gnl/TRDRNA2_/TRDRNA2_154698_c0_seq1.p1  ORF type:complete len:352 (-),score=52.23 gnl/TRDRNA2_/TRDRNA2_154698_c0_seq1:230-1195(-)
MCSVAINGCRRAVAPRLACPSLIQCCGSVMRRLSTFAKPRVPIQMVALDVDGTLLDSSHQVHPRVRSAILQTMELGIPVVLSTGRSPAAARSLVNVPGEQALASAGGVFLGGAIVLDSSSQILSQVLLPRDSVQSVLSYAEASKLTAVLVHGDEFWCAKEDAWTNFLITMRDPAPVAVGWDGMVSKSDLVNLVCLMGRRDNLAASEPELHQLLEGSEAQLVKISDTMFDIVRGRGKSALGGKAAGLATLCSSQAVPIPPEAVMAVGDSGNDVDMLTWAGWSVAMGNATPSALEAADIMVSANDDPERPGVAEALETFVLAH